MRGFVQGSLWALVVGSAGLTVASLASEQPQPFAAGPASPQMTTPELATVEVAPSVALPSTVEDTPVFVPAAPLEPTTETAEAAPQVSTAPATPPETVEVATAMDTPQEAAEPQMSSAVDAPLVPSETTTLPDTSAEAAVAVDETPAPQAEEVIAQESVVVEITPQESDAVVEPDEAADAPLIEILDTPAETSNDLIVSTDPALTDEPVEEVADSTEPAVEADSNDAVIADDVTEDPEVAQDALPAVVAAEPEQTTQDPAVETPTPTPAAVAPEVAEDAAEAEALPQTNTGVRINRPTEDTAEETAADVVVTEDMQADVPALARYAAEVENPDDLPLISIILLDEGAAEGPSAIADMGFVPTVAVDALSPEASDMVTAYRAAGVEVAMQISLPSGAQPTDVEVAFEAAFGIVPEAAMFFSDGTGVMQGNRGVTAQVMEILAASGHGFVTIQRGLGNAARAAAQEGVPAATILRDLDGADEDPRAITRALDQAAFRARQSGGAVLMGRVTPETIAVLRDWAAALDPAELLIAPVSAVLLDLQE